MEMGFLDTFAMVALRVRQAKETLLQKGVLPVPESKGDVLVAVGVADTGNAILTPSVGAGSRMLVGEICRSVIM